MISVIIPVFNAEKTLEFALNSVKNQSWNGDFEIIIVNDGSKDKSAELAKNFAEKNPELHIQIINQQNKGVSAARNAGLRIAKGEYLALLDADDQWLENKTEKQMQVFANSKFPIDFLVSLWNDEQVTWPYTIDKEKKLVKISLNQLLLKITGQTSTAIFKRKVLENTGYFDENQRYSEDANFWMRATEHNEMYLLPESLVIAGDGKKSFGHSGLSANLPEMEKGIQKNLREMRSSKRISDLQYFLYFAYSKFKYILRPLRAKL